MTILKLSKWGNSHGIRLSKDILDSLKIFDNNEPLDDIKFDLSLEDNKIILTLKKDLSPLEKLFEGFNESAEDYKCDIDWGKPVGNEVW